MSPSKFHTGLLLSAVLSGFAIGTDYANPTGPAVVAGSATVQSGAALSIVHQTSNAAIINWQSFSINAGQTTKFIQPGSRSAVLNRVLGGGASILDGTLGANGQVFLLNQNGILIGKNGLVDVEGGFTASTRDISDSHLPKGGRRFVGHDRSGVKNLGEITSVLGDIVLIGKTVGNNGSIIAPKGTVGLVAGDNVLLGQKNADGTTITVNPSPVAKMDVNKVGVQNTGSIIAASTKLEAANGNIYSMAINNSGAIRATIANHQGGHVWLTSDTGLVTNTGKIEASGPVKRGTGGSVLVSSIKGTAVQTGSILARGGLGGQGGQVNVSGYTVELGGSIDTRAAKGSNGNVTIGLDMLDIITGGNGIIIGSESQVDPATLQEYLGDGSVTLSAVASISVDSGIAWTASNSLTFQTTGSPGTTLTINAPISGPSLTIQMANPFDQITTGANGAISVGSFILANGNWIQDCAPLPAFSSTDFELHGNSSFLRAQGGDGSVANPYLLSDIYGVQGIGSPSGIYLASNFGYAGGEEILGNTTETWNGGAGFVPIGSFSEPFVGSVNGLAISSLFITPTLSNSNYVGLFGVLGSSASITGLSLQGCKIEGELYVGTIAGYNNGAISECDTYDNSVTSLTDSNPSGNIGGFVGANSGTIDDSSIDSSIITVCLNSTNTGGFVGFNSGIITNCFCSIVPVAGGSFTGGFAGYNSETGAINSCSSTGATNNLQFVYGTSYVGGFVGYSMGGTIQNGYSSLNVSGTGECVGGFLGYFGGDVGNVISCSCAANVTGGGSSVGGFVGDNDGCNILYSMTVGIDTGTPVYLYPTVLGGSETGGFAGSNEGTITSCTASVARVQAQSQVGGFVGSNSGLITSCQTNGGGTYITSPVGQLICTGTNMVGGFAGLNSGSIYSSSTLSNVQGVNDTGGFVGDNSGYYPNVITSIESGSVTGSGSNTGGFVGFNGLSGGIASSTSSASVEGGNQVGGFAGQNSGQIIDCFATLGSICAESPYGNTQVGGFVGCNLGTGQIAQSYTTESVQVGLGSNTSQVGGFAGDNAGSITICSSSAGTVTGNSTGTSLGGFVGKDEATSVISNSYTTDNVVAPSYTSVGGFSGIESGTVSFCYSSGRVTGVEPGGFIGQMSGGTTSGDYWLQDASSSFNVGLPSIGLGANGSSGITPGTRYQLMQASTYQPNGPGGWDFTLVTGVWGVNGYSNMGSINNGLPFFQAEFGSITEIVPLSMRVLYNGTASHFGGPGEYPTDLYGALEDGLVEPVNLGNLAVDPFFTEVGSNTNAGTTNQVFLTNCVTNSSESVIEAPEAGILTIVPTPFTLTATPYVSAVYGTTPSFGSEVVGNYGLVPGNPVGGNITYTVSGNYDVSGYLNVGTYAYTPHISAYNPNYTISGFVTGTVTITPATLTYIANPATGEVGQMFPRFSGELGGFLPGDSLSNATTGTLSFTTSASGTSPAGSYSIDGNGLSASNYIFVQDPTNATAFTLAPNGIPNPIDSGSGTGLVIVTTPGGSSTGPNQFPTISFTAFPSSLLSNAEAAIIGPPSIYPDFAGSSNPYLYNGKGSGQIVNGTYLQEFKKKKRNKKVAK